MSEKTLKAAMKLRFSGKSSEATEIYQDIIAQHPGSIEALEAQIELDRMHEALKSEEQKAQDKQTAMQRETEKQEYANSFNDLYEYDVITIVNANHGQVDKTRMINIINEKARQGWRLHTVYSNELGKNAVALLGFGMNSTASEDVLIFERRIKEF